MLKGNTNRIICPEEYVETIKIILEILESISRYSLLKEFQYIYLDENLYTLESLRHIIGEPRTVQRNMVLINRLILLVIEQKIILIRMKKRIYS